MHNTRRMGIEGTYRGRRAASIENEYLRLTVLAEGGHISEVFDKHAGINPLWTPPWPSIEHSAFNPSTHEVYGGDVESSLLSGIMGHNLCLDIFGGPSAEEAASGLPVHGEASAVVYDLRTVDNELLMQAHLPQANLNVERRIELHDRAARIRESVHNPKGVDHPVGWTQHVTLGPPFLKKGETLFRASVGRSKVIEKPFGAADYLQEAAEFEWPHAPRKGGGTVDLQLFTALDVSNAYTAHLVNPQQESAFFAAFSPEFSLAFGYVWRRRDFPWLGIWEENYSRSHAPWNGRTLTRGMEFGVSPFPESRREMIERGPMFGTSTFRWISAGSHLAAEYWIVSRSVRAIPETLTALTEGSGAATLNS
jgi:hypothetical protein